MSIFSLIIKLKKLRFENGSSLSMDYELCGIEKSKVLFFVPFLYLFDVIKHCSLVMGNSA
jgi:hypothetical protein